MTDFPISIAPDEGNDGPGPSGLHVAVSMFRVLRHLLPDADAWRLIEGKTLTAFMRGLAERSESARSFIDATLDDFRAEFTRELAEWEFEFGLIAAPTEEARRAQIAAAKLSTGGQSPRYIQDVLQTAGFDVFVHEWWVPGSMPRTVRDPRDYTEVPLVGTVQCKATSPFECREDLGGPAATGKQAQCNAFLANDPRYIVNKNRRLAAPPPIPSDPLSWRFFLYFGGETFGDAAEVPAERRDEFERLIRKVSPSQQWLVTMITYI